MHKLKNDFVMLSPMKSFKFQLDILNLTTHGLWSKFKLLRTPMDQYSNLAPKNELPCVSCLLIFQLFTLLEGVIFEALKKTVSYLSWICADISGRNEDNIWVSFGFLNPFLSSLSKFEPCYSFIFFDENNFRIAKSPLRYVWTLHYFK